MSVAGDIVTALLADITTAVAGVTTSAEAVSVDELNSEDFPHAMLLQTAYEPVQIEWGQQRRVWTLSGTVVQKGGTREDMQAKLEAIGDQIAADDTLGGAVDRSLFASSVSHSHSDSVHVFGVFVVQAEKVV